MLTLEYRLCGGRQGPRAWRGRLNPAFRHAAPRGPGSERVPGFRKEHDESAAGQPFDPGEVSM